MKTWVIVSTEFGFEVEPREFGENIDIDIDNNIVAQFASKSAADWHCEEAKRVEKLYRPFWQEAVALEVKMRRMMLDKIWAAARGQN
jgi:hypothetical protein